MVVAVPKKITLTLGGLSVVFGIRGQSGFADSNLPRTRINTPQFSRSVNNSLSKTSTWYEPPFSWSIQATLDPVTFDKLDTLYELWLQSGQPDIVLADEIQLFKENASVGTRPIASGTETTLYGAVRYFAQFNVYFVDKPAFVQEGRFKKVSVVLQEGVKLLRS